MKITPLAISGVCLVELERLADERGFFARSFCEKEFAEAGLLASFVQCNVSYNKQAGTVRGMHFQKSPFEEVKLVRCTRGAIVDIVVDLRRSSDTYRRHIACELSAENGNALYIPTGCAHGFQTLCDDVEILYYMGAMFHPEASCGLCWDDPAFDVSWPLPISSISDKDRKYPALGDTVYFP